MVQSLLGKIILSPLTALYGLIIAARNVLYDTELVRSTTFSLPVISVGNLTVGGAGKTPHIEYLIRLLSPYLQVGTLSRGYKRNTNGFKWVQPNETVLANGDEPLMYARKYRDIVVAVAESRSIAIPKMVGKYPSLQTILLDDAFQHRAITPGLNILLTTYDQPFTKDYLMPSGRLREWRSAYTRADIVIVTKCAAEMTTADQQRMIAEIKPQHHQQIFFTYYKYHHPYGFYNTKQRIRLDEQLDVILISAIANTKYLLDYLHGEVATVHHMDYEDHHLFSERDIEYITSVYNHRDTERKIILTTEKDAMRLDLHRTALQEANLPIFVLPAEVDFLFGQRPHFDLLVKDYLLNFKI